MTTKVIISTFFIAALSSLALGQNSPEEQVKVLSQIQEINQKEIRAGKLAEEKATRDDVKSFGKHLVTDHTKLSDQVAQYAQTHKLTMDETNPPKDSDLGAATGKDFDRKFIEEMVKGHDDAITMVKTARDDTSNSTFKSFLNSVIPSLQKHETTAQALEKKLPGNG